MNSTMQETISVIDQGYLNDNRQHVKRMVRSYLDKNGLSHSQFRRTMVAIENAAKQRNGCLVWVNDSGYVLGVVVNDMGHNSLAILQVHGVKIRDVFTQILEFAKIAGIKKVVLQSYRKRSVVKRWLGPKWKIGPTLFETRI